MATWSIVNLSESIKSQRIDSEYFDPSVLEVINKLKRNGSANVVGKKHVRRGFTPTYSDNGVPIIRSGDLGDLLLTDENLLRADPNLERIFWVEPADILISSIGMGSIGKIAVYLGEPNTTGTVSEVTVVRGLGKNTFLAALFLAGRHGQALIAREVTGATGQQHLNLPNVARLLIPSVPKLEPWAEQVYREALTLLQSSITLQKAVESLLLVSLGLSNKNIENLPFSVRNFSETLNNARFDAEFFQPKYQAILNKLRSGGQRISSVASLIKNSFHPIPGKLFKYIEIGDLRSDGGFNHIELDGAVAPSRAEFVVGIGDVLTSTVRPIRQLTGIVDKELDGAVCSSGFAVLRPNSVTPELLSAYLRLPPVTEILDLYTTASMYPAISTDNLMRIPFLYPGKDVENEVTEKLYDARCARDKSVMLINKAIQDVERLIDQGV